MLTGEFFTIAVYIKFYMRVDTRAARIAVTALGCIDAMDNIAIGYPHILKLDLLGISRFDAVNVSMVASWKVRTGRTYIVVNACATKVCDNDI